MIYAVIILAVIARFIPHMPNFAPITALAIFSGANLGWKKSVAITLAARFTSDIFLGFFSWPLMVAVYACHLAGVLFGIWIKKTTSVIPEFSSTNFISRKYPESSLMVLDPGHFLRPVKSADVKNSGMTQNKLVKIIISSLGGSVLFFLVTNFAFFYGTYAHNLSGIILAYANGLPFFQGTLLGDFSYSVVLFGGYDLVQFFSKKLSYSPLVTND